MAFVVEEVGRSGDVGNDANTERQYFAHGYATEALAEAAILAYIVAELGDPPNLAGQVLARIAVEETELVGAWRGRASWKWVEKVDPPPQATSSTALPTSEDDGELSFDIGVESVRVQFALTTTPHEATGKTLPAHGTAINWNPKAKVPEGVDVYDATFGWSETHYFHESKMTRDFRNDLKSCAGKTNDSDFRGNAPGEVIFMGVTGRKRSKHDYALTFSFKGRENGDVDFTGIGVTDPVPKKGWEYVEVVYSSETDGDGNVIPDPLGVLVHQPIEEADFSKLGIGT